MPRTYGNLTDVEILRLFKEGHYTLVGSLVLNRNGKPLTISYDQKSNPYPCVRLYFKNKRKHILLHKLLWMLANGRTVPQGRQLHHTKTKQHCTPEHVILLTKKQHLAAEREKVSSFLSS